MLFDGTLEIDHQRGVIYFHDKTGITRLRICRLPKPIPNLENIDGNQIDLTITGVKANYSKIEHGRPRHTTAPQSPTSHPS